MCIRHRLIHLLPRQRDIVSWSSHHVRFGNSGLFPLSQRMSSIIYCQLQKLSQPRPWIKFLPSLPFPLPINRLAINRPPLSITHRPSNTMALWLSTVSKGRLQSVVLGEAISRIPSRRTSLVFTVHSMTPIARLRGGYLLETLSRRVRHRLGRTLLPYSDVLSSRVVHRKTGHAAPFDDLLLT